jgi:hypothetical protein
MQCSFLVAGSLPEEPAGSTPRRHGRFLVCIRQIQGDPPGAAAGMQHRQQPPPPGPFAGAPSRLWSRAAPDGQTKKPPRYPPPSWKAVRPAMRRDASRCCRTELQRCCERHRSHPGCGRTDGANRNGGRPCPPRPPRLLWSSRCVAVFELQDVPRIWVARDIDLLECVRGCVAYRWRQSPGGFAQSSVDLASVHDAQYTPADDCC